MATVQRKVVHKQFNSPLGLYSDNNVKSTLNRELKAFSNGAMGVECDESEKPVNLANSAVLQLLREQEQQQKQQGPGGVKRVTWPPEHEYQARAASVTRQSPGFQPRQSPAPVPAPAPAQPQAYPQSNVSAYPSANAPSQYHQRPQPNQPYQQTPSNYQNQNYPNYPAQPPQQQQQYQQQYQQPQQPYSNPDPTYMRQSTPSYLPPNPVNKPISCTTAFAGGLAVGNKPVNRPQYSNQQPTQAYSNVPSSTGYQQQQQQPLSVQSPEPALAPAPGRWGHVKAATPVHSGYVQPQYTQPESYPNPSLANVNQYQQQAYQQPQYQSNVAYQQPQYEPNAGYKQQPQQSQQPINYETAPQNQSAQAPGNFYRQPSPSGPGVITLRKELPTTQRSAPVYASDPAAHSYGGGSNMRGDQKWPPEEYKRQSEIDNEARRRLALGPACRPRLVHKDYTQFFNRHALNSTYPGYRAPPGTQHYPAY